jgi:hypothetical protein
MPGDTNSSDKAPLYDDTLDACNPDNFNEEEFDEQIITAR